jgi:hypothetical protein
LAGIERVCGDVDAANAQLDGLADELAAEARTVEVEMEGT